MKRSYLFLQGPIGPFFYMLGQALAARGDKVLKINFNSADKHAWHELPAANFTGDMAELADYYENICASEGVTDIIMFGDSRPVHDIAINIFKEHNLRIHVFEEGYFRPNWITYERNGVNRNSSLPATKQFYNRWENIELPIDVKFGGTFSNMAWFSFVYYVTGIKGMYGEFKKYKHHFGISPHKTIGLWTLRLAMSPWRKARAKLQQRRAIRTEYFITPLQLCRDYQIKLHSQFKNMPNFIDHVICDFAKNSNVEDNLLLKIHPLENNSPRLKKAIKQLAAKYNVKSRVKVIDGGHLPTLINNSKGMIVANSTSALSSIHHEKPVIALSPAIYNFKGLTNQGGLAKFWVEPESPDMELYNKFKNYVIYKTQINGSFYHGEGLQMAVEAALARISKTGSNSVKLISTRQNREGDYQKESWKISQPQQFHAK